MALRGHGMKRFIEGQARDQVTLLPECLEDWADDENSVRVIDAFVDALDLGELGFAGVDPRSTGRPAYHPSVLLKLFIYGYLNAVQSSRKLEREARCNIEVMWLLGRLVPDHKTIAEFRRNNGPSIRKVCAQFVELCRPPHTGKRRDRWIEVQGGQQPRPQLHGSQNEAAHDADRGKRRALHPSARKCRSPGTDQRHRHAHQAPEREDWETQR